MVGVCVSRSVGAGRSAGLLCQVHCGEVPAEHMLATAPGWRVFFTDQQGPDGGDLDGGFESSKQPRSVGDGRVGPTAWQEWRRATRPRLAVLPRIVQLAGVVR